MKNLSKILLASLLLLLINFNLFSQSEIYSEDFTGQNGKGAYGPTPTTDLSGVTWSLDISNAELSASSDWFKVVNEVFEARDIDGDAIWYSPSINISNYTNVSFNLTATESGTMESNDIFNTHYRIDGGSWIAASTNGSLNDDFGSGITVSQLSLSGNTLEIKVTMNNGASSEYHRLDNIVVSGTSSGGSPDPEPTNHPTSFSSSAQHEVITLTWTDATGSQVPSKYLIIGETDPDITNPSNGSPISNDIVASDGRIVLNISQGTESASFSNVGNSTWHFEIFPYTNSGSNISYKTDGTIQTSSVVTNAIQITEINYNNIGTDYEWIELYNPTDSQIDISGYVITDSWPNTLATIPNSTSINAESYFVITTDGDGNTPPNYSADYDPGSYCYYCVLNDDGDSVILKDSSGNLVDQVDYVVSSPWPTTPNGSSYFTLELISLTSNNYYGSNWQGSLAEYGSPGQKSTEAWDTNNNSSSDLNINNSEHRVISTDIDASISNITVSSGSSLTINKNGSLTVSGNFTNNGTVTLNSDADEFSSIIVEGTSSGDITYNRYVNIADSGEWDLIGSPVGSLSISSFVSDNSSPLAQNSGTYALGTYDNSNDSWTNYTDNTGSNDVASASNFPLGKGYQMASTSGATLAFTGTVATSNQPQSVINNDGNGSGGRRWNLVANPFPSYLNLNTQAHATNNFLKVNIDSGVIDSNFGYLYGWDADGTGYTIYNNNAGDGLTDYIAPGQGFFIAAASSGSISFTTVMRTTSGGDDFISGRLAQSTWSRFYLRFYENENFTSETQFYFEEGLSLGLDPGHDAGAPFEDILMSRLPDNDQGIGMAINAMGLSALDEETVIPLVLNRDAGVEFSISFEDSTIPEDVGVYLEDTLLETLTDLRSENFTLTPESDLSDMGRFYLRIGNTSLGGNDLDESYISIYKAASDDFVTIEGLSNVEKANVQLFNIIGQEVLNKTLNSNQSTQRVSTSGLTAGVYVIRLQADSSVIAKKIIIN